jgi:hypothetical protein
MRLASASRAARVTGVRADACLPVAEQLLGVDPHSGRPAREQVGPFSGGRFPTPPQITFPRCPQL